MSSCLSTRTHVCARIQYWGRNSVVRFTSSLPPHVIPVAARRQKTQSGIDGTIQLWANSPELLPNDSHFAKLTCGRTLVAHNFISFLPVVGLICGQSGWHCGQQWRGWRAYWTLPARQTCLELAQALYHGTLETLSAIYKPGKWLSMPRARWTTSVPLGSTPNILVDYLTQKVG